MSIGSLDDMMKRVQETVAGSQANQAPAADSPHPPQDAPKREALTSATAPTKPTTDDEGWGDVSKNDTVLVALGDDEFTGTVVQTVRKNSTNIKVEKSTGGEISVPRDSLRKIGGKKEPMTTPEPALQKAEDLEKQAAEQTPIKEMSAEEALFAPITARVTHQQIKEEQEKRERPAWLKAQDEAAAAMGLTNEWKFIGTGEFLTRCMIEWVKKKGQAPYPKAHRQLEIETNEAFVARCVKMAQKGNFEVNIGGAIITILDGPGVAFNDLQGETEVTMDSKMARNTKPGDFVNVWAALARTGKVIFSIQPKN